MPPRPGGPGATPGPFTAAHGGGTVAGASAAIAFELQYAQPEGRLSLIKALLSPGLGAAARRRRGPGRRPRHVP